MPISDYYTSASLNISIAGINIGEGMDRADVNNAIRQMMADIASGIGNANLGALPAGSSTPFVVTKTASGNAAGNTDWRATTQIVTFNGAFGAQQTSAHNFQANLLHTAGTVAFAYGIQGYSALGTPSVATTTGNVSSMRGIEWHLSHTGSGTIGDMFGFFSAGPDLDVGTGLVTNVNNYRSGDLSGGAGSNRITGAAYGYFQANSSVVTTPIMAAYGSEMSAGLGRWGIYFTGGAPNSWAGHTRIGDNAVPVERLEVVGNIKIETGGHLKVGTNQVVGARQTGTAAVATDPATTMALVNDLRAKLVAHGLIA